jgi:di/tripeptidase
MRRAMAVIAVAAGLIAPSAAQAQESVYPYPINRSDLVRMHGNDERVPVAGLEQGTDWITRVLTDVAAAG